MAISEAKICFYTCGAPPSFAFDCSHRDADTDSVNTMVVHEDEGEGGEGEQAGGYGDQTMLVQRVSQPYTQCYCLSKHKTKANKENTSPELLL